MKITGHGFPRFSAAQQRKLLRCKFGSTLGSKARLVNDSGAHQGQAVYCTAPALAANLLPQQGALKSVPVSLSFDGGKLGC